LGNNTIEKKFHPIWLGSTQGFMLQLLNGLCSRLPNRSPKRLKGDITYHQRHKIGFAPEGSGVQRKHHLHFAVPHSTGLSIPLSQTHYPAQNMNSDYSL